MNARLLHPCRSCAHVKYETNMWWCMLKCMENIYIYSMLNPFEMFQCFRYAVWDNNLYTNYITKHFQGKKSIHFRLRKEHTARATQLSTPMTIASSIYRNAYRIRILHSHFPKWQFNGLFVNGFVSRKMFAFKKRMEENGGERET